MVEEDLRIQLDPARRPRKAARRAGRVGLGMFGVAGLQRQAHAARRGAQLLRGAAVPNLPANFRRLAAIS